MIFYLSLLKCAGSHWKGYTSWAMFALIHFTRGVRFCTNKHSYFKMKMFLIYFVKNVVFFPLFFLALKAPRIFLIFRLSKFNTTRNREVKMSNCPCNWCFFPATRQVERQESHNALHFVLHARNFSNQALLFTQSNRPKPVRWSIR